MLTQPSIDLLFRALADPTRRMVLEHLGRGPASVSQLAEPFGMAMPSFLEHLRLLEGSGLVKSTKTGRVRTYEIDPRGWSAAEDWLAAQRSLWERRLDQLDAYLLELKAQQILPQQEDTA